MEEGKNAVEAEGAAAGEARNPRKKMGKKAGIFAGVIAGIVVIAGIGFFVWHEQPSFCNAICHSPMDPYVEGYQSDDKSKLVVSHRLAGNECLDCHESNLGQQIGEGVAWVTGDFADPIGETLIGTRDFCFRCHDDGDASSGRDWEDIVAATADFGDAAADNPHDNHNGNLECYDCHSVHGTSKLYCTSCHNSYDLPEGWDYN